MTTHALIVVDVQNDFLPGGALAVPEGDQVVTVANDAMRDARRDGAFVVATQDWHPPGHESFASTHAGRSIGDAIDLHGLEQVLWPDHCVQGTAGASFASALDVAPIDLVMRKGTDPEVDSYSGFFDNGRRHETGLADALRSRAVRDVTIVGLATDYCVKWTALDAVAIGFATTVRLAGCRGVELAPGDVARAVQAMRAAGVTVRE